MTAKKKRPVGRPKLPKGQERSDVLTLRLTPAERARIEQEAKRAGRGLSEWARDRLLGEK